MADLHGSHASINKAMDLARTCIYWPGMEADITDYIKRCLTCIKCSNLPIETLQPHEVPPRPWVKIGVDFFQDFSKFPYMFPVASTHHFETITHLRELFAAEGVPAIIMSDNGPPFNGEEFRQFSHDFDFMHTTSSPHFHQLNEFIKAMVKKVKNTYKKMDRSPNSQARALLQLHDTPITADLLSPAEILHGHPAQGTVLSRPSKRVNICQIRQRLVNSKKNRKNTSTEPTEPKIYIPSRSRNKSSSFTTNNQVDNWYSDRNIRMWMILHDPGPQWQSLQKEQSSLEAHMS